MSPKFYFHKGQLYNQIGSKVDFDRSNPEHLKAYYENSTSKAKDEIDIDYSCTSDIEYNVKVECECGHDIHISGYATVFDEEETIKEIIERRLSVNHSHLVCSECGREYALNDTEDGYYLIEEGNPNRQFYFDNISDQSLKKVPKFDNIVEQSIFEKEYNIISRLRYKVNLSTGKVEYF